MNIGLQKPHVENDGAIRVREQDNYYSELVGLRLCQFKNAATLATDSFIDSKIITLNPGHGFVNGEIICLKEKRRFYQAYVINVATNEITLDTPLDYAYSTSCLCTRSSDSLVVNGSVTTQIFSISPPVGDQWDILGCGFHITDNSAMDDSLFGAIAALANGIVLRKKDKIYKNILNIKTNGDFYLRCDNVEYSPKAPSGFYGLSSQKTFNIRHGIAIRLDGNARDELQVLVQDDLSTLASFKVLAWGHVVESDEQI